MRRPALPICLAALATASTAFADPIVIAPGGTRDELQAVMDGLTEPTVVLIPPGEWECIGTVLVTTDGVTILGSGAEQTRLYRSTDNADTGLRDSPFIRASSVDRLRVTGLRIDGVSDSTSGAMERGIQVNDGTDLRVDHCTTSYLGFSGVVTYGSSRGVVDHCRMLEHFKPVINNLGYGVTVFGDDTYWNEPYGTAEATFIEDSFFTGARHASASNRGARYVFRYNHVTANEVSHAIDAHGDEYNGSSDAGTEWIEVYENLVDSPVYTSTAIRIRGGGGLIWNNEVHGYSYGVGLTENTPQETGPVWIWSNTWGSGVTALGGMTGTPEYYTSAPSSYTPYTYPHPLVTDLDVQAGPDMVVAYDASASNIFLDGSQTSTDAGSIAAYRWIEDADQIISTCSRDIVDLAEGKHVLVLEVERDDGYTEVDSMVVDVQPAGPLASTADWAERWFVPLAGTGTVTATLTPAQASQDAYITLAGRRRVAGHTDSAIILRTSNTGLFEAYDGDQYAADTSLSYQAGQSYQVQIDVDLSAQTYSVTIDGTALATDFAFRRQESSLGQLTAWHSAGGLTVEGITVTGDRAQPDEPCREPGAGGAGGAAGAGGSAGSGGTGTGGAGASSTGPGATSSEDDGGCGCRTPGRRGGHAG
ncbi:MAG: right-handed parallel beta-helix repeat-containing protein, partial [Deltaproteobacteria bacterium]|nr:right-handed parallel beta-helix repeat-containing protein [Deltaproteobacteria bacterium]MBW2534961.1 right-handed parallel beta-helix repeat-containing protein [Deltaproteobacteria bacterium]